MFPFMLRIAVKQQDRPRPQDNVVRPLVSCRPTARSKVQNHGRGKGEDGDSVLKDGQVLVPDDPYEQKNVNNMPFCISLSRKPSRNLGCVWTDLLLARRTGRCRHCIPRRARRRPSTRTESHLPKSWQCAPAGAQSDASVNQPASTTLHAYRHCKMRPARHDAPGMTREVVVRYILRIPLISRPLSARRERALGTCSVLRLSHRASHSDAGLASDPWPMDRASNEDENEGLIRAAKHRLHACSRVYSHRASP